MVSQPMIIDRGRGPEIAGTRITVYDVMDYYKHGWPPSIIAALFEVMPEQVEAAIAYINEHQDEVVPEYQKMLERDAKGNPPEVQAKLEASRGRVTEYLRQRERMKSQEAASAGNPRGR